MKAKPQMSLAEMAARAAGTGRLVCPKCGCADFVRYKTRPGVISVFRYKACRNCGHKVLTASVTTEKIIRDVVSRDDGSEADQADENLL